MADSCSKENRAFCVGFWMILAAQMAWVGFLVWLVGWKAWPWLVGVLRANGVKGL